MPVSAVTAVWSGWPGGPGLSTFHFDDARGNETNKLAAVRAFMIDFCGSSTVATDLPVAVKIDVNPIVETFDEVTGDLLATTFGTKPATILGNNPSAWFAPVGACVAWTTGLVHDVPGSSQGPHLVRGRTFFVPLGITAGAADGTIDTTVLSGMNAAVAAFLTANPDFVIWSRPVDRTGGAYGVAVAGVVRDKIAVLRSRRD